MSEMPLFPHEIQGIDGLTNFADVLYPRREFENSRKTPAMLPSGISESLNETRGV